MARDDYYVVVYQILSYLYYKLKKGEEIDEMQISHTGGKLIDINKKYWNYIMYNLYKDGYIEGVLLVNVDNATPMVYNLSRCQITPKGIEFLTENSTIEKAKNFFKDIKEIIPFI